MKVYFAGNPGTILRERNWWRKCNRRLMSYHYIGKRLLFMEIVFDFFKKKRMKQKNKVKLFLDSGAFSAWTQGVVVDIQEYIQFIKKNRAVIDVYANLDVIGIDGEQPNMLTAQKTLENQKIMENAGLAPIPVFHYGEPYSYLEYYCENYEYIALGVAGNAGKKLIPWLDVCFAKYICDKKGMPRLKVHGFAVTSVLLMIRYPWYSVDSTSWVISGRMGGIFVPQKINGKWDYHVTPWKIFVSSRSPNKKEAGKHILTMPPLEKQVFLDYIKEKGYKLGKSSFTYKSQTYELAENERWVGKKPKDKNEKRKIEILEEEGVCNRYELRDELNIIYFLDLEKSMPNWPWRFEREQIKKGLF